MEGRRPLWHNGISFNQVSVLRQLGLTVPSATGFFPGLMETSLQFYIAGPPGTQETIVMPWNLIKPSITCDKGRPHQTQETTVKQWTAMAASVNCKHSRATWNTGSTWTLPLFVDFSVHCDKMWPHATQETIGTQLNVMEPSFSCVPVGPVGS